MIRYWSLSTPAKNSIYAAPVHPAHVREFDIVLSNGVMSFTSLVSPWLYGVAPGWSAGQSILTPRRLITPTSPRWGPFKFRVMGVKCDRTENWIYRKAAPWVANPFRVVRFS